MALHLFCRIWQKNKKESIGEGVPALPVSDFPEFFSAFTHRMDIPDIVESLENPKKGSYYPFDLTPFRELGSFTGLDFDGLAFLFSKKEQAVLVRHFGSDPKSGMPQTAAALEQEGLEKLLPGGPGQREVLQRRL
jgi:hypothetical protein